MPSAPPTRCPCGQIATRRGRCDTHQPKPWATPSANARTLTRQQRQRFHDEQLAREPQCRVCGSTRNLEADHIIPIAEGGAIDDPANGQTLCEPHHAEKTEADRRRGIARRRRQRQQRR